MAKKKVGSVHTCKNGAKYKIMPNGRARFISGPTRRAGGGKKKKGGFLGVTRARNAVKGGIRKVKRGVNRTISNIMY